MIDFNSIPYEIFESICARLLREEGFIVERPSSRGAALSFDYFATPPQVNERWAIEVKQLRTKNRAGLRKMICYLVDSASSLDVDKFLLITSMPSLAIEEVDELRNLHSQLKIEIWTAVELNALLNKSKHRSEFEKMIEEVSRFTETQQTDDVSIIQNNLISRFRNTNAGQNAWREYEDLCIDTLIHLFVPPLRPPAIQSTSEDSLDRRDAIFSLTIGDNFWNTISNQFNTRLVVFEFKNFVAEIGQIEVECLREYLYPPAMRSVGLLCSRLQPAANAIRARRRAWQESRKLILFVSDIDFVSMINAKQSGLDPTEILVEQIDNFFRDLCP